MDSFKDKIAEKFGTTDLIRANSEAETRELNNAKSRIEDLENAVSEMRRLSLKCAETNELTTQVIQASIEKIEETSAAGTSCDYTEKLDAIEAELEALKSSLEASFKDQEEVIHKENVRVYRNVQAAIIDELKQQSEAIAAQHLHIERKLSGIKPISIIALVFSGISMLSIIAISVLVVLTMGL